MTTARIFAVLVLTAMATGATNLSAQSSEDEAAAPSAEPADESTPGTADGSTPGTADESTTEPADESTPGTADDVSVPVPPANMETRGAADEDIIIPDANLDEEPTIGADDDVPVTLATGPLWVIRPVGGVDLGISASERDLVNPLIGVHVGVTRWDAREGLPTLASLHSDQTMWGEVRARVEVGVGGDVDIVPTLDGSFSAIRTVRFLDRDSDGFTTSLNTTWGRVHVSRNLRVQRGVRLEATAGDYGFGVTFAERPGVAMLLDMHVGLPGYTYVSAQGRADAFHGLQLTRLSIEAGPRFGDPNAMWVRFVGGGGASTAIGAELGPTATVRSDMTMFAGADAQFHPMAVLSARLHYDAAQDSYRNRIDGAWRVLATVGTRF